MKKTVLLLTALMCAGAIPLSYADDGISSWLSIFSRKNEIAPVTDA